MNATAATATLLTNDQLLARFEALSHELRYGSFNADNDHLLRLELEAVKVELDARGIWDN